MSKFFYSAVSYWRDWNYFYTFYFFITVGIITTSVFNILIFNIFNLKFWYRVGSIDFNFMSNYVTGCVEARSFLVRLICCWHCVIFFHLFQANPCAKAVSSCLLSVTWTLLGIVSGVALVLFFFGISFQFSFLLSTSTTHSVNKSLLSVKYVPTSIRTCSTLLLTGSIKSSEECKFLMLWIFLWVFLS